MTSFDQRNKKSLNSLQNPLEMIKGALAEEVRLPSIVEFAEHPSFLGADRLFPRQKTLLRLMCLETENMTDYDIEVINKWAEMFNPSDEIVQGINPDIWKRVEWLKANGYDHFKEIITIIGRRGGKNHLGAILLAYQLWKLILLDDPQEYYGVAKGKSIYLTVVATAEKQAKIYQFADLINLISEAKCFAPYIADLRDYSFALTTPADKRRIASLNARGIENQRLIASVRGIVASSNAAASRGGTVYSVVFDEFAHMIDGTEGPRTSNAVYQSISPALDQFQQDALIFIPTSPYNETGMAYELYRNSIKMDKAGNPEFPTMLTIQLPSWAQPLHSKVLTPTGYVKMSSLSVGDEVVGSDGKSTRIKAIIPQGVRKTYKVQTHDRGSTECSEDHLWTLWRPSFSKSGKIWKTVRTEEIAPTIKGNANYLPLLPPVEFKSLGKLVVPPYVLGALLGDGHIAKDGSCQLADTYDRIIDFFLEDLYGAFPEMRVYHNTKQYILTSGEGKGKVKNWDGLCTYDKKTCKRKAKARRLCFKHIYYVEKENRKEEWPKNWWRVENPLSEEMKRLKLNGTKARTKFIPEQYKMASIKERWALVQGLMDTDGYVSANGSEVYLTTYSSQLTEDFVELITLLGGRAHAYKIKDTEENRIAIVTPKEFGAPFRMKSKVERWNQKLDKPYFTPVRRITKVEYIGEQEVQCISVEAKDGLYVTDNGLITHNSPYEDWDNVEACEGLPFNRRQVPQLYDNAMRALEQREPETFRVERLSQWAKVSDAFLNPRIVERIFQPFKDSTGIERILTPQDQGKLGYIYYGHADPSKNNNNFAVMVAHSEEIYDAENNETWTHVIVDYINCYKPEDFPEHQIDYALIEDDLIDVLDKFRSIRKFTFDQYGSFVTVDSLKKRLRSMRPAHRAMILEEKASLQSNMQRAERFKSAIGMNWVHSFKDQFGPEETCLLEQELKFLQLKNGKVQKQSYGPIRTEDLSDCIQHCVDNLLEDNFHKLELRDRLGKTTLGVAAMGGYHSHTPNELSSVGKVSGRQKLKSFSSTWRSYNNQGHDPARGRYGNGRGF